VSLLLVLGGWWVETSNLRAGGCQAGPARGRARGPALSHAEQRLCNIVDELCIAAHGRPQVMVLPRTDAINAFAAGWDAEDAVVPTRRARWTTSRARNCRAWWRTS
jgi:hypothetical protein